MSKFIDELVQQMLEKREGLRAELRELDAAIKSVTGKDRIPNPSREPLTTRVQRSQTEVAQLKVKYVEFIRTTEHKGATIKQLARAFSLSKDEEKRMGNIVRRMATHEGKLRRKKMGHYLYFHPTFAPEGCELCRI